MCKGQSSTLEATKHLQTKIDGCTMLSKLLPSVRNALESVLTVSDFYYWSDSTTALCWIRIDKQWKQYISDRVDKIRKLTLSSLSNWRHCPGHLNPADLATRGITSYKLVNNRLWFKGPDFLSQPEDNWPSTCHESLQNDTSALSELVKHPANVTYTFVNSRGEPQDIRHVSRIDKVVDCDHYGNIHRLLRVTAFILRFVTNMKHAIGLSEIKFSGPLSAEELLAAKTQWVLSIQAESFPDELQAVCSKKSPANFLRVKQLGLFIGESGILRCRGRLDNSKLPFDMRNPALLPSKHYFISLVIKEVHCRVMHSGVRMTLTTLREAFRVPRGREVVKRLIKQCFVCNRFSGTPYPVLAQSSLPEMRVDDGPPWSNTGVDYAGPLFVVCKNSASNERITEKVYICLCTCVSTRAVHLELVKIGSTDTFLLAVRRFSGRRGLPHLLIYDNAKHFKSCCKEIQKILRSPIVQVCLANAGLRWKFIVEKAPWWGGGGGGAFGNV